jgi:tetratricopeptide (TPR) repeat protein
MRMPSIRRTSRLALLACALACVRAPGPAPASGPTPAPVLTVERLPARKIRVRAYADDAYRSQSGTPWEERVKRQLARASEVTTRRFNTTFELADARPWHSNAPATELPDALLQKLEALDPGQDVDLVLGYVSSLPAETSVQEALGRARVLGRHVILRGLESPAENGALRDALKDYPPAFREETFLQRRTNKETALFLHHWGHALGAPHSALGLMHDTYGPRESFFTPDSVQLITIGLLQKPPGLDDPAVRAAWAKDVSAFLASPDGLALEAGARRYLGRLVAAGSAEDAAVMSRDEHDQMSRAEEQDRAGHHAEAAGLLRPLLEAHPEHARLHAVACQVQIRSGAASDEAWTLCHRAEELDPRSPSTALFVADLAERRKDPSAPDVLARARAALEQLKDAPADHWLYLAGLHRQRDEVTLAESALDHAAGQPGAEEIRQWAQRTRRWVGLAPGAVPPEHEGAYVATFRQAKRDLEDGRYGPARQEIDALEKDYAGTVGALTLRCELQIRQASGPRGLGECRRALERYPDSVHAHYLLGMALSTSRAWGDAAAALERVVELDPTTTDAWPALNAAYRASGNAKAAGALRDRYQQRFGKPPVFK